MLYVVANVYSKIHANLQAQNLHQSPSCRIRPNRQGPRQRTICSLGSLEPAPAEDWLGLAHKLQSALQGQESLSGSSIEIQEWVEKARNKKKSTGSDGDRSTVTVEPDRVQVEQAREAGPVHVGH